MSERAHPIPSLDGLRCLAILPVFLSHVLMAGLGQSFIPGNFGVTLFFFLSGYLITTLLRLEIEKTGAVDFRLFYLRRALRIFPTCYVVLAAAALYGWVKGTVDPWWLLGQVLHLTNYQIIRGGWLAPIAPNTDVFWSLAVEEHFYLVFPALFVLLARLRSSGARVALLLAACALVFLWRLTLTFVLDAHPNRTYLATDTRIDSILFGCVLALWGNPALDRSRYAEHLWKRVFLPLAVLGLLASFVVGGRAFRETFGYTLQGLCLFPIFIVAVRYSTWGPMRLLNWPPVMWIGTLSYAIYLVHPSAIHFAQKLAGGSLLVLLVVATALTLAASALLYRGIEVPAARLRRKFSVLHRAEQPRGATGSIEAPAVAR
ncbi:MAG TPA: acyltransferase [Burkholderiales bacterium]|nr:acyltransferase [Burkholderiales bacterium]